METIFPQPTFDVVRVLDLLDGIPLLRRPGHAPHGGGGRHQHGKQDGLEAPLLEVGQPLHCHPGIPEINWYESSYQFNQVSNLPIFISAVLQGDNGVKRLLFVDLDIEVSSYVLPNHFCISGIWQ